MYEHKIEGVTLEEIFEAPPVTIPDTWIEKVETRTYQTQGYLTQRYQGHTGVHNMGKHQQQVTQQGGSTTNMNSMKGITNKMSHKETQKQRKYDMSKKNRDFSDRPTLWQDNPSPEEVNRRENAMMENKGISEGFVQRLVDNLKDVRDEEGIIIDSISGKPIALSQSRGSLRPDTSPEEANETGNAAKATGGEEEAGESSESSQDSLGNEIVAQADNIGEYEYYEMQYGELVGGAKEDMDIAINELKQAECLEGLEDAIRQCFEALPMAEKLKMGREIAQSI